MLMCILVYFRVFHLLLESMINIIKEFKNNYFEPLSRFGTNSVEKKIYFLQNRYTDVLSIYGAQLVIGNTIGWRETLYSILNGCCSELFYIV